ncbi:MAG: 30S ribosomal protein S4 [Bacteroides sp.]|nr:30S ribosomal protein S4 [Bacillota bacterium]MCM1393990.1 30S ribosomal protein S4 [[Eubacterium] siraeum]MCM1455704.1 30S ribosomal protein S4 [Bacteroides sp.]
MAKYTGPVCRLCRREGCKLYLKGTKCNTDKCPILTKYAPPGIHGKGRKKSSGYSIQLREKQKTKRYYGVTEKQFRMYYDRASEMRGVTGENMLILIERRLDNVVYRLGLGTSRAMARQIVNHGHITVNGKTVDIASYSVKVGDVIAVKENKKDSVMWNDVKETKHLNIVKWLSFDNATLTGSVVALPERADIDLDIQEHLIVELYSK